MKLWIDGRTVDVRPDQSLLQAVRELGLDRVTLSERPLAAKIAGEVFTLNYIPQRQKDCNEAVTVRKAMEASGGRKKTVCLTESGKALAERTVARLIEVENDIFAAWTQEDREQYLALTQRYLNDFKEKTRESLGG